MKIPGGRLKFHPLEGRIVPRQPLIRESEELKHVMVLEDDRPGRLLFRFQAGKWAFITLGLSIVLFVATFFMVRQFGLSWAVLPFFLFAVLFAWSTLYSLRAKRWLEIDADQRRVHYTEQTLYKNESWDRPFGEFRCVRIYHPRQFGEGHRRTLNLVIELIADDDRFFRLGYHEFGAVREGKAAELGRRIAGMMNLPFENRVSG